MPPSELNPGVARDLEKILLRCLEKNPARRYETMESLERALWKIAGRDATRPLQAPVQDYRLREEASHVSPDVTGAAEKWVAQFRQAWADPRLRKWIIAGAVALVLIVAAVMNSGPAGQGDQIVTIEVTNGKADVYENGEKVGATPYQRRARLGDSLHLQLRRSGALDQDIDFDVTERHVYSYTMQTR
jgi:hypothetical protein